MLQTPTSDTLSEPAAPVTGLTSLFEAYPPVETAVWIVGILLLAWLANTLTRRYILKAISRIVTQTKFKWDDVIFQRRVFRRLAHIAPAIILYYGTPLVPGLPQDVVRVVQRVALGFVVLVVVLSVDRLLTALNDIYSTRPDAKSRPIKGYLQIVKIVLYIAAGILVISALLGQDPLVLLGGFGAMTAVLLLVFKDTILSLVASVQITQYDMIAVGDWIEMPEYGADGDVIDIALHTIKVQNWDKTITTIPTYKFIEDSFKNWRGMSRAGGRRVKRSIHLDTGTVRFLTEEEIQRFGRFELLRDYVRERKAEIDAYNAERRAAAESMAGESPAGESGGEPGGESGGEPGGESGGESGGGPGGEPGGEPGGDKTRGEDGESAEPGEIVPNARRLTNVGTFRAYIVRYLRQHPMVHQGLTLMVRQLQPEATGLPMEVYVFCNDTNWVTYEGFQSDLFDHLLSMVPEFGLRVFQSPSGEDVRSVGRLLAETPDQRP